MLTLVKAAFDNTAHAKNRWQASVVGAIAHVSDRLFALSPNDVDGCYTK
jgi:hypothetical protein